MGKQSKVLKNVAIKNFRNVVKGCRKIAKSWDVKAIPLPTIQEILQQSKIKTESDDEGLTNFLEQFNKTLDITYLSFKEKADEFGSDKVSVDYIEACINELIKGLK